MRWLRTRRVRDVGLGLGGLAAMLLGGCAAGVPAPLGGRGAAQHPSVQRPVAAPTVKLSPTSLAADVPGPGRTALLSGEAALGAGDAARARAHFQAAAATLGPDHPAPVVGLVLADWLQRGLPHEYNAAPSSVEVDALRSRLDAVIAATPDFGVAWLHRGRLHLVAGRAAAAYADLTRAELALPQAAEVQSALGVVALAQGKAADAVLRFERAADLEPSVSARQSNLGGALLMAGRSAEALSRFRRAVALLPDSARANSDLGTLLVGVGRESEALAYLYKAATLEPRATFMSNLGYAWYRLGNTREATRWLQLALAADARLGSAWLNLGIVRASEGRCADARRSFESALELDGEDPRALENIRELVALDASDCRPSLGPATDRPEDEVPAGTPGVPPRPSAGSD